MSSSRPPRKGELVWLLPLLLPVVSAGGIAVVAASVAFASSNPRGSTILGVLALFAASVVAEALPVEIDEVHAGSTSLSTIFIAGAAALYGWAPAILVGASAMATVELFRRRVPTQVAYNIALYALSAAVGGLAVSPFAQHGGISLLLLAGATATLLFYFVDISLLAAIVARSSRRRYRSLVDGYVRMTVLPASIMASFTIVLVALWHLSPPVAAALVGPLVAISLYQRSVHRELAAMRLARTDPLTGLGNRRAFDDRLQQELDGARSGGQSVALCLIDIDDFKGINDAHGHAVGDIVLAEVGARLRRGGEAFRLGGDEFALILPGSDADNARLVGGAVLDRLSGGRYANRCELAASVGVALYPQHGTVRAQLIGAADRALYASKELGKNRVEIYRAELA